MKWCVILIALTVFTTVFKGSPAGSVELIAPGANLIVIHKAARTLVLYWDSVPIRTYHTALGWQPVGAKQRQGDGKTPEGVYRIVSHNPDSRFHLSLGLSYPQPADTGAAILRGADPGNAIMIHGGTKPGYGDWTDGCIAVSDGDIEEIYTAVSDGTPVMILP